MVIEVKHTFDDDTYRHSLNGHEFVLHCHHYMSLTAQMAEDFADIGGVRVLREATEDSMRPIFEDYYREHGVTVPEDRLAVGAEYFKVMGLGLMEVQGTADGGEVKLPHSHVDEGWVTKWTVHDKPINHFGCGYVAALFAATFDKPARSFEVSETASIVMGAPESVLVVKPA
jgi:hypothetical protein